MSSIPDEFYLYLAQKGYSNTCRGHSSSGGLEVPTVQVDSCEIKYNETYFKISYPFIKARFDATKQGLPDNRDPTATVRWIFDYTGGEKEFEKYYDYYTQGKYDANAKVFGNDSIFCSSFPERYVTDTEIGSALQYNMWVNESGVFKMDDISIPIIKGGSGPITSRGVTYMPNRYSESFTNHLIGCLIKGIGYENIEFPLNGSISCMLKDAGIVKDAITEFYKKNKGKKSELQIFSGQINGNSPGNNPRAIIFKGMPHPETFIGSGFITISQYNEKEILVKVFDIKSIFSGDFVKEARWFGIDKGLPMSLVRDSTKSDNRYTNTSQTYSFTLPIEFKRLEKGK